MHLGQQAGLEFRKLGEAPEVDAVLVGEQVAGNRVEKGDVASSDTMLELRGKVNNKLAVLLVEHRAHIGWQYGFGVTQSSHIVCVAAHQTGLDLHPPLGVAFHTAGVKHREEDVLDVVGGEFGGVGGGVACLLPFSILARYRRHFHRRYAWVIKRP